jgi:hypothetical protein
VSKVTVLPPDDWLNEWGETSEGNELWLSARNFSFQQAYDQLKDQCGVRNMPLDLIELGWIKWGYEEDDVDHDGEEMYWRGRYKRGSYPVWFIEGTGVIEKYGGCI